MDPRVRPGGLVQDLEGEELEAKHGQREREEAEEMVEPWWRIL